ncbi:MAG TPA: hypothetical protein VIX73_38865 [Kofleriaceae bacterium]|jgi:hypothetical protein
MPPDPGSKENLVRVNEAPPASAPLSPDSFSTDVQLTMGKLSYIDGNRDVQSIQFQFNPTELERSRTIKFTRTPTGNTLEEMRVGVRNQAKRKFTRKPDPWSLTLALRFDAGYYQDGASLGPFKHKIDSVTKAMRFFEALVEPSPFPTENEKIANADETPPPPLMILAYGTRTWQCAVKTVRIKEEDYTRELYPRRLEVTLTLEVVETVQQNEQGKTGGNR